MYFFVRSFYTFRYIFKDFLQGIIYLIAAKYCRTLRAFITEYDQFMGTRYINSACTLGTTNREFDLSS